jgi:hypothetical protein
MLKKFTCHYQHGLENVKHIALFFSFETPKNNFKVNPHFNNIQKIAILRFQQKRSLLSLTQQQ